MGRFQQNGLTKHPLVVKINPEMKKSLQFTSLNRPENKAVKQVCHSAEAVRLRRAGLFLFLDSRFHGNDGIRKTEKESFQKDRLLE